MIDEKKLAELREAHKSYFLLQPPPVIKAIWETFPEIAGTIEALWKENAELKERSEELTLCCRRHLEQIHKLEAMARAATFIEDQLDMLYEGHVLTDDQIMGIGIDPWGSRNDFKRALVALRETK